MRCLSDVGEFGFIERLARMVPASPYVVEGIGDDCAVLRVADRLMLVSTDLFVEGIHFRREGVTAPDIGWKAASACLSDIAAMGGAPLYCLTSLACPASEGTGYIEDVYRGMLSAMSRFGTAIVGGDTTRSTGGITLDVIAIGEAIGGRYLPRRGAKAGRTGSCKSCCINVGDLPLSKSKSKSGSGSKRRTDALRDRRKRLGTVILEPNCTAVGALDYDPDPDPDSDFEYTKVMTAFTLNCSCLTTPRRGVPRSG
jgi:hypothetical protein